MQLRDGHKVMNNENSFTAISLTHFYILLKYLHGVVFPSSSIRFDSASTLFLYYSTGEKKAFNLWDWPQKCYNSILLITNF